VFFLYWFVFKERRIQNAFIIIASYIFYGWWNWHYVFLIAFSTACSYCSGIFIEKYQETGEKKKARAISIINVIVNLSILCYFKYFNFFIDSIVDVAGAIGWKIDIPTSSILLPLGISFYTFQAIGYTIDVMKRRIKASHDPLSFFAFVSFFPQLVAGPIERARNLLPQFDKKRSFDYSQTIDGGRQMIWGFLKKMVIADNCAKIVDGIFLDPAKYSSLDLSIGLVLFFFQLYGDFSGYSDIAIGTAKLFGIRLSRNFNAPLFSRNIAEFWRRCHITLNSWFFDYVFCSMKGWNKKWKIARNVLFVFLLSGLWHGADYKFILWGLYFGVLSVPFFIKIKNFSTGEVAEGRIMPSFKEFWQMASTFALVLLAGPLFRCSSVSDAFLFYKAMFTGPFLGRSVYVQHPLLGFICLLVTLEWFFRGKEHPFRIDMVKSVFVRYAILLIILFGILLHCSISTNQFVYFEF